MGPSKFTYFYRYSVLSVCTSGFKKDLFRLGVIYVGDDTTDEDAMKKLKGLAMSFRVTDSSLTQTWADHRLTDLDAVTELLEQVESTLESRDTSSRCTLQSNQIPSQAEPNQLSSTTH